MVQVTSSRVGLPDVSITILIIYMIIYGFAAYADRIVKKYMGKRGYRRPEDRLKASFWGTLILMPISVLIYGWLLKFGCVLMILTASPGLISA